MKYNYNELKRIQGDDATAHDVETFYRDFTHVDRSQLHEISDLTKWIRSKGYGSDVREVIAQLFERTWYEGIKDGNSNLEVAQARGSYEVLAERLDAMLAAIQSTNATESNLSNNKVDKNGVEQITFNMLSQEVKQKLTGGSVAVVGNNAVSTSNIVDRAVTGNKIAYNGNWGVLKGVLEIDLPGKTLTLKSSPWVMTSSQAIKIDEGSTTIDRTNGLLYIDINTKKIGLKEIVQQASPNELPVGFIWNDGNCYINAISDVVLKKTNGEEYVIPGYRKDRLSKTVNVAGDSKLRADVNTAGGSFSISSGSNTLIFTTDRGQSVRLKGPLSTNLTPNNGLIVFDFNKQSLSVVDWSESSTLPPNQYFVGALWVDGGVSFFSSSMPLYINKKLAGKDAETVSGSSGSATSSNTSRFSSKRMWFEGDSMTIGRTSGPGIYSPTAYPNVVKSRLGLDSIRNDAVSGATVATTQANNSIAKRILDKKSSDLANFEFYSISGGTNDYNTHVDIGTETDTDTKKYIPALIASIEKIYSANPLAKIVLLTPHFRMRDTGWKEADGYKSPNNLGYTLNDYADAMVAVAKKYQIPVLDWRKQGQILNKYNYKALTTDYLHFTDAGYEENGHRVASWLESIF